MSNQYLDLEQSLWPVADATIEFFRINKGLSRFNLRTAIDRRVRYITTISTIGLDKYFWCVDISATVYRPALDDFILDCSTNNIPVKLYIAYPANSSDGSKYENIKKAQNRGAGLVEIDIDSVNKGIIIHEAIPLNLIGLRERPMSQYPCRYRSKISEAIGTFKNSSPTKGCSLIYDEIEYLSRKVITETKRKGYWANNVRIGKKEAWDKVLKKFYDNINLELCGCPQLTEPLINRIRGITTPRNESGHAGSPAERMRRDLQLRTRFETACDLLLELINAVKPLKLK